ncbi:hypothetical protein PLICRDRAFT_702687 [Plicaturopsis crispa FD-325 SS-3]|uniref:Uncharacterized protein n=1 Tax=Plicaturopsis crispa FD-325 SS-3 TaxID=944288 RepID=A0A0C9SV30_PLICR|nr:hypothetical protein PLICRDRAFT_702687 [Plicaturopsis crispa FD-325 SS-3]
MLLGPQVFYFSIFRRPASDPAVYGERGPQGLASVLFSYPLPKPSTFFFDFWTSGDRYTWCARERGPQGLRGYSSFVVVCSPAPDFFIFRFFGVPRAAPLHVESEARRASRLSFSRRRTLALQAPDTVFRYFDVRPPLYGDSIECEARRASRQLLFRRCMLPRPSTFSLFDFSTSGERPHHLQIG